MESLGNCCGKHSISCQHVEIQHSSELFLRWLLSFSTSTVILLWGGKYTQNRDSFVNPRALEPECARWFSQSVHCQVSALRVMFFLSISWWCWEFKGNAALSCLHRARRVVTEESKNKPAALLVTRVTRKCSFPLLNDRLHPVKVVKQVHWKRPAGWRLGSGLQQCLGHKRDLGPCFRLTASGYLLWEVVPVDVVAVGVAAWTLNVDAVTLQDCGFLEEEDESWDSGRRHAHVIVEFRQRGLYYNAGIIRTLKCNVVSTIFCQMLSV